MTTDFYMLLARSRVPRRYGKTYTRIVYTYMRRGRQRVRIESLCQWVRFYSTPRYHYRVHAEVLEVPLGGCVLSYLEMCQPTNAPYLPRSGFIIYYRLQNLFLLKEPLYIYIYIIILYRRRLRSRMNVLQ